MEESKNKFSIEPDRFYTPEEVVKFSILGIHSTRIDSFARPSYKMLELDWSGKIKGSSLIRIRERLGDTVCLTDLAKKLEIQRKDLTDRYEQIFLRYFENIFPKRRKRYTPIYIVKEGADLSKFASELTAAIEADKKNQKQTQSRRDALKAIEYYEALTASLSRKSGSKLPWRDYSRLVLPLYKALAEGLAKLLSAEEVIDLESRIALRHNYKGERIINPKLRELEETQPTPAKKEAVSEISATNSVQKSPKKEPGDLEVYVGKSTYFVSPQVVLRYCKNEDLNPDDFKLDELALELTAALPEQLKPEMRVNTKTYMVDIQDGRITSLM